MGHGLSLEPVDFNFGYTFRCRLVVLLSTFDGRTFLERISGDDLGNREGQQK